MTDLLYDVTDVETAVRDMGRDALPAAVKDRVYAGQLPVKTSAAPPYLLVTVRAPRAYGPGMAGDQDLEVTVGWTVAGLDPQNAARIATSFRALLLGRDRRGAFTTPITLPSGRAVIAREGNEDGAPDNVDGIAQWTETAQLTVGRA